MSVASISKNLTTRKPLVVNVKNIGLNLLDLNGQIKNIFEKLRKASSVWELVLLHIMTMQLFLLQISELDIFIVPCTC